MKLIPDSQKSDWAGIVSSGVCIVHCLALPIALSLAGVSLAELESYHWLDYLFVIISAVAVLYSMRQSRTRQIRFVFVLSWVCFAGSVLLKDSLAYADLLMYAGSFMLIFTHAANIRQSRQEKNNTTLSPRKPVTA